MDSSALITYQELINNILILTNKDNSEYWRYEAIGLNILRNFRLQHMNHIQVVELAMDDNHRIKLPDDCLWVKCIGFPKNGRLWTITRDDRIYLGMSIVNGIIKSDSDTLELIPEHTKHGYNARGRNSYNFTIDYNSRQIVITGSDQVTMTIHYISSGISITGDTFIPAECISSLESAIIYRAELNDSEKPITAVRGQLLRGEMKSNIAFLRKLYTTYTPDEWHDMFLKNQSQGVIR
jgi:hypothetical protein